MESESENEHWTYHRQHIINPKAIRLAYTLSLTHDETEEWKTFSHLQ